MKLAKSWTALITPFADDGLDLAGLRQNIKEQIEAGIEGILVLGTTGETPTLSAEEKRLVIRTAVDASRGRAFVMVGTGTNSTKTTIDQTREAEELGADIALVVTPYYNRPTQEGIYAHYQALSKETGIPVCLYNIPKRCGRLIENETLIKLASLPGVVGVKDATGSLPMMSSLHQALPEFLIWSGDDPLILPMMALGAVGAISVSSNLVPQEIARMINLAQNDRFREARALFHQLSPIMNALFLETNPIPVKAAMQLEGKPSGSCRLPLTPPSRQTLKALKEALEKINAFVLQSC